MNKVVCIILAGGKGSRFGSPLKFLSNICGKPLIEKLLNDVEILCEHAVIALSKKTLGASYICATNKYLSTDCIETSGDDFVKDLVFLLDALPKPLFMIAADVYVQNREILVDFLRRALEAQEDIITLTIDDDREKLIGITFFKKNCGSWRNISYPKNSVIDVDKVSDLEMVRRLCH
ncbi:MAG: NTP transferase domain-containing protein [Ignisphaera sp.]